MEWIDCAHCDGFGARWCDDSNDEVECPRCSGTGEVDVYNGESANDPVANGCTDALTLMDDEQRAATELFLEHRAEELRQGLSGLPFEFDPDRLTLISAGVFLDDGRLPLDDEPQSAERLVTVIRFDPDKQWGASDLTMKAVCAGVTTAMQLGERMVEVIEQWGKDGDDG
jgi:phage FluMu protein Com